MKAIYLHESRFGPMPDDTSELETTVFCRETIVNKLGKPLASGSVTYISGPDAKMREFFVNKVNVWQCSSPLIGDWTMANVNEPIVREAT
jgi:hypothetical protein